MRTLICLLLLTPSLVAQGVDGLDLRTDLGTDPIGQIHLVTPGCWDGLILGRTIRPARPEQRRPAEATVEVWDLALREAPRQRSFDLYLGALQERLSRALALPPPKHQSLELTELMLSDPSNPQKLDLTKVKSMQERFNKLPPNGSPVK